MYNTQKEQILIRPINELARKLSIPGIAVMLMTSVNAMVDDDFAGQFVGSAAINFCTIVKYNQD